MNEEIIKIIENMITLTDILLAEQISNSQDDWNVSDDKESLIYSLAFNDGLLSMAQRVKEKLNNLLPKKFEKAEDDQS